MGDRTPVLQEPRVDRRGFLLGLGATAGLAALAGCGLNGTTGGGAKTVSAASGPPPLAPDKGRISMLTWEGYTDPAWLKEYAAKTGVEVAVTTAGSVDEMFAKAKAAGADFDLAQFDLGSIPRYIDAGLIVPFDPGRVAGVANISPGLPWKEGLTVKGQLWGLPYNWGTEPLMWNTKVFPTPPTSWAVLWDPAHKGKVTIPDDSYLGFPMVGFAAGVKDPYNLTDADFETVKAKLSALRPQLKTLTTGFNDAENLYGAGDCVVGYCQNVAVVNDLTSKGKPFAYGYPTEGTPFWIDNSILFKGGARKEVYDFVDHMMSPQWQGRFIAASGNAGIISYDAAKTVVPAAKLATTEVKNQADASFWPKMKPMTPPNRPDERLTVWNEFKAGL